MTVLTSLADRQDWLPDYLLDTRFMLHDPSGNYFSDAELVSYINEARSHVCVDTGCLRQRLTITLPGGQEAFPIGGVYALTAPIPIPSGGTAPYQLVSGAGATATANTGAAVTVVSVTAGGYYYQPPLVSFDPGEMIVNISASGTAVLNPSQPATVGAPSPVSSVYINFDNGQFNANNLTPTVQFASVGVAAHLTPDGLGNVILSSYGAGQAGGVVMLDAAGVITSLAPSAVSILDRHIASIDQMTVLWGSQRVPMRNYAYSDFSVATRGIVGFQSVPVAFTMYASVLYIGPIPNQAYSYELDCIMYPAPLLDYRTVGQIMDLSSIMAVKYYAAYRAKLSQNETEAAAGFLQLYQQGTAWSANRFTTRLSQLWPDNENLD